MSIVWTVEKRKVSDLKLNQRNPRKISKDAYQRLLKRIQERGFHDVIKVDTDDTILSGNQRKRALLELGIAEVDVKVPDRKLSDKEQDAVILESNISDGEWAYDELANYDFDDLLEVGFKKETLELAFGVAEAPELPELNEGKSGMQSFTVYYEKKKMAKVLKKINEQEGANISEKFYNLLYGKKVSH